MRLPSWGTPTVYPWRYPGGRAPSWSPTDRTSCAATIRRPARNCGGWAAAPRSRRRRRCSRTTSSWSPAAGGPEAPIFAVHAGAAGDITGQPKWVAWQKEQRGPYMPTPLIYDGYVYVLGNAGVFDCYDLKTGAEIYRERIPHKGSGFSASPVASDGRIYLSSEDGDIFVVKAGPQFELLGTNAMGEPLMATPAISGGLLLVRERASDVGDRFAALSCCDIFRSCGPLYSGFAPGRLTHSRCRRGATSTIRYQDTKRPRSRSAERAGGTTWPSGRCAASRKQTRSWPSTHVRERWSISSRSDARLSFVYTSGWGWDNRKVYWPAGKGNLNGGFRGGSRFAPRTPSSPASAPSIGTETAICRISASNARRSQASAPIRSAGSRGARMSCRPHRNIPTPDGSARRERGVRELPDGVSRRRAGRGYRRPEHRRQGAMYRRIAVHRSGGIGSSSGRRAVVRVVPADRDRCIQAFQMFCRSGSTDLRIATPAAPGR